MRSASRFSILSLLLALAACGGPQQGPDTGTETGPDEITTDAGTPPDELPPRDAGSDPNLSWDAGDPAPVDGGTPVAEGPARFVVVGDTGRGNSTQSAVAGAMRTACESRGGCQFALLLGDNFYPTGVSSVSDPQFQSSFEKQYAPLGFPFHVVLGNHDYGNDGNGVDPRRAQYEIDYSKRSDTWRMPAATYDFTAGPVDFLALDTQPLYAADLQANSTYPSDQLAQMRTRAQAERDAMAARLAHATHGWRVAFGHHPYVSNGPHGNAGSYDGHADGPGAGLVMKAFVDEQLCGKVDVYFAGHDHSLQDLGERCGTTFVVSGAGAETTSLSSRNQTLFQSTAPGFVLVEASAAELHLAFFDQNARLLHERTITRSPQVQ